MIGYKKRVKLVASVLLIAIPLVAFILFCASEVAYERIDDARKYRIGSDGYRTTATIRYSNTTMTALKPRRKKTIPMPTMSRLPSARYLRR